MKYHRCNLFKTSNGQGVGFAHVYLELKEVDVDFTDLEFVLEDNNELVGVEESDVGSQSGGVKTKSMVGDEKLQRNSSGGTSEGFIKEEISDGKETGHIEDKDEDNTVHDKSEDIAKKESIKVKRKKKDLQPAPASPNFEESLTESPSLQPPSSSSSRWEDTNVPQGLPSVEREEGRPIYSLFGKYFSETNLSTGSGRKKEIVECKLCRETGKVSRITRPHISAHMRSLHLPEEECNVCGKYVKSRKMPLHQIMCGSTCERSNHDFPHEGFCKLDKSAKRPRSSKNCPYCEKTIPTKNFQRDFERHLRISCPESPVKIS